MASVYDSFRETAKSLLNDYGKDAVLVRGEESTNITIFELGRKESQKRDSNLHFSGNTQLVETSILIKVTDSTDVDFSIENGDIIVFDSYKWQIKDYDTVVGDKNVIYKAVIQRGDISDPITPNPPLTGTELTAFQTHLLNTTDAHGIDVLDSRITDLENAPSSSLGNKVFEGINSSYKNIRSLGSGAAKGSATLTINPSVIYHSVFSIHAGAVIDQIQFEVKTAIASSLTRVGICSVSDDGDILALLAESADIDTASIGNKYAAITPVTFDNDSYVFVWISSDSAIGITGIDQFSRAYIAQSFGHCLVNDFILRSCFLVNTSSQPNYPSPVQPLNQVPAATRGDFMLRYQ